MSMTARRTKRTFSPTPLTISQAARHAVQMCISEALEPRRLFTVIAVPATPPANTTGAQGSTGTVELTRSVDNGPANHTVEMTFPTGTVDIQTFDAEVPQNVQNFLHYVRG